jgi:hypothetical protein
MGKLTLLKVAANSNSFPDWNHIFDTAKGITSVVSLLAFIAALITLYFIYYNYNERQKLKDNPNEYVAIAEKIHIDFKLIPLNKRSEVTLYHLKTRIQNRLIVCATLVTITVIGAFVIFNINGKDNERHLIDLKHTDSLTNEKSKKDIILNRQNKAKELLINQITHLVDQGKSLVNVLKPESQIKRQVDFSHFVDEELNFFKNNKIHNIDSSSVVNVMFYTTNHPNYIHTTKTDSLSLFLNLQSDIDNLEVIKSKL